MFSDSKFKIAAYGLPVIFVVFFVIGAMGIGLPSDWSSATGWESMPWDTTGEAALKCIGRNARAILFGLAALLLALVFPILYSEREGVRSGLWPVLVIAAYALAGLMAYTQAISLFHL